MNEQAKLNKGVFVISKGKIEKQPICQLCVPESKRLQLLKLAYDSMFGCHLGERKIRERVRLSFYWPRMRHNIQLCSILCPVSIVVWTSEG